MTEFGGYSYDGVSAVIGVQHTEVANQKFGSLLIIGLFLPFLVSCFGGSLEERLPC